MGDEESAGQDGRILEVPAEVIRAIGRITIAAASWQQNGPYFDRLLVLADGDQEPGLIAGIPSAIFGGARPLRRYFRTPVRTV
jgi:hypothetical protein